MTDVFDYSTSSEKFPTRVTSYGSHDLQIAIHLSCPKEIDADYQTYLEQTYEEQDKDMRELMIEMTRASSAVEKAALLYIAKKSKSVAEHKKTVASKIAAAFKNVFDTDCGMKQIPNQYHGVVDPSGSFREPWYEVYTNIGMFVVGWRSSVMDLNWAQTIITADGEKLFEDKHVTKNNNSIHAYNYDMLEEFLRRLKESLNK